MMQMDLTFALDIGTRSVVGIAGRYEGEVFKVLAADVVEHKKRAMLDGQIHDIEEVAEVVRRVKESIEAKLGVSLSKASIAAAGRVLKTRTVKIFSESDPMKEIDRERCTNLEIEALKLAQSELDSEFSGDDNTFYCVGYSVVRYFLNNYEISSIIGHRGKSIGVELISTFLPQTVVDSLHSVLVRAGLEIGSLTLEPIAAINAAIPGEVRLLNLALVDIGAGTSDIAITRGGTVVGYGMVPIAGDEVTEAISENLLVSFSEAEVIKIKLSGGEEELHYTDILGIEGQIKVSELMEAIKPSIENLAEAISSRILDFNQKAPAAVFMVGGGSQLKGLSELVAGKLGLPLQRVGVRGREAVKKVHMEEDILKGPEAITPLGIATTAHMDTGHSFINIKVMGNSARLFNTRKLRVSDALMAAGIEGEKLIPSRGRDMSFILDGQKKYIKGEYGSPAEIFVNGRASSIQDDIRDGDSIHINSAQKGKDAAISIGEIVEYYSGKIKRVLVNGIPVNSDYIVKEGDQVNILALDEDADSLLVAEDLDNEALDVVPRNDKASDFNDALDEVSVENEELVEEKGFTVRVNGEEVLLPEKENGYIFVDIFNFIDMDLSRPKGRIILRLNGNDAAYTDILKAGDEIEIYWK